MYHADDLEGNKKIRRYAADCGIVAGLARPGTCYTRNEFNEAWICDEGDFSNPSIGTGLVVGLLIGLAVALKIGMNFLFEGRKTGLYAITVGYHLVSFVLSGLIIGAMQG